MDPDAAVGRVASALRSDALGDEAWESWDGYVEWTGRGGFLASDEVRAEFGSARASWETTHGEGAFQDAYRE